MLRIVANRCWTPANILLSRMRTWCQCQIAIWQNGKTVAADHLIQFMERKKNIILTDDDAHERANKFCVLLKCTPHSSDDFHSYTLHTDVENTHEKKRVTRTHTSHQKFNVMEGCCSHALYLHQPMSLISTVYIFIWTAFVLCAALRKHMETVARGLNGFRLNAPIFILEVLAIIISHCFFFYF